MSTEPANIFEQRFPSQLDALSRATHAAVQFLKQRGATERTLYLANLAIEELGTNILKYGYSDATVHEIGLRLEMHPEALWLAMDDDGHAFNPLEAPEPDLHLPAEQRAPGGLGLHLVRQLVDEMQYQREGGRNRLTIKIRS